MRSAVATVVAAVALLIAAGLFVAHWRWLRRRIEAGWVRGESVSE